MKRYLLFMVAVLLTGCAGLNHGATYQEFKKRMLVANSLDGVKRLQIESDFDPSVRNFIKDFGRPDYLYVDSIYELYFVFLSPPKCVQFTRPVFSNIGSVQVLDAIPRDLAVLIPDLRAKTTSNQRTNGQDSVPDTNDLISAHTEATPFTLRTFKIVDYQYTSRTKKGSLSVDISGHDLEKARTWVVNNIGKIASSKELLMEAGQEKGEGGRYRVLDESVKDGILKIDFTVGFE